LSEKEFIFSADQDKLTGKEVLSKSAKSIVVLLPLALFSVFILPRLFALGMFLDGMTYGAISRNLAEGLGSFWNLHYSFGAYPIFREHPPLAFFLQAQFVRVFGDYPYIDALWSALLGVIILFLTGTVAREFAQNRGDTNRQLNAFLAPTFLLLSSTFVWTVQNNLLELSLSIFTLASAYCVLRASSRNSVLKCIFFSVMAGICIGLAFLCKGPVGLFPLAMPFILRFSTPGYRTSRALTVTFVMLVSLFILSIFIWLSAPAKEFFSAYFKNQVVRSLAGEREVAGSKISLLEPLFGSFAVPLAILLLISLNQASRGLVFDSLQKNRQRLTASGLIAFSASLPLFLSPKQMAWYIVPSLPFYAIFFSELVLENWFSFLNSSSARLTLFKYIQAGFVSLILLGLFLMVRNAGKPRRDGEFFRDVLPFQEQLGDRPLFTACRPEQIFDWGLVALLQRHLRGSIVLQGGDFVILDSQGTCTNVSLAGCSLLQHSLSLAAPQGLLSSQRFTVYRCAQP